MVGIECEFSPTRTTTFYRNLKSNYGKDLKRNNEHEHSKIDNILSKMEQECWLQDLLPGKDELVKYKEYTKIVINQFKTNWLLNLLEVSSL